VTVVGLARFASADTAADHLKRGADHYKAGRYADAITELSKAYELEPKPETLFPLAQAERLNGDCKTAAEHYKKILSQVSDVTVARAVQQNLELCEKPEDKGQPATTCTPAPAPPDKKPEPAPAPAPTTVTKVVERDRTDVVGIALVGGGALAFGIATGLFFAASPSRDAADRADSIDSHDELAARSDRQQIGAIIAAGLGTAALGIAGVRWVMRSKSTETSAEVAVVPSTDGVGVWATGRF
jgi:hypothetical protein